MVVGPLNMGPVPQHGSSRERSLRWRLVGRRLVSKSVLPGLEKQRSKRSTAGEWDSEEALCDQVGIGRPLCRCMLRRKMQEPAQTRVRLVDGSGCSWR
jgi:hypothetical protein